MTLKEKIDYISGYDKFYIRAIPRLGIPAVKMADGPQGLRNDTKSTMFPAGILSASTWNRGLVHHLGEALGEDARARGVHILLGPGVNIYRSPYCGRNFEYFGEDPYLSGEIAVEYIKGVQSKGVIATVKHYAANNQEWDRYNVSSDIDERTLHEIYLMPFEKAVKEAGVGAVMNSYNLLNSVHTSESSYLNIDVLRCMWGFEGILMSDWASVYSVLGPVANGLDLEMPSGQFMNYDNIRPLIDSGVIRIQDIDLKVQHILQTIIAMGFMDRPQLDDNIELDNHYSDSVALELAREGIVMLKNDGVLPVKKGRTLVLGHNAKGLPSGGGAGHVDPIHFVSVAEGLSLNRTKRMTVDTLPAMSFCKEIASSYGFANGCMRQEIFGNTTMSGKPLMTSVVNKIDFDWSSAHPISGLKNNGYSVRWTGKYKAPQSGVVYFTLESGGGYRLSFGERNLVTDWDTYNARKREVFYVVEKGREYDLMIEFKDKSEKANIVFEHSFLPISVLLDKISAADNLLFSVGFDSSTEGEAFDRPFEIPGFQQDFIDFVHRNATDQKKVLVLNAGGAVDMSGFIDDMDAILMAWYPGQQGGTAIGEIFSGKISPSGKLPISVEKDVRDNPSYTNYYNQAPRIRWKDGSTFYQRVNYREGVFCGYRGYEKAGIKPLYEFGFGMSYSSFEYSNLKINKIGDTDVQVRLTVSNIGNYDASEVVQVYVSDVKSSVVRPGKELKGFEKVFIPKGESVEVVIELDEEAFRYFDVDNRRFIVEKGDYVINVGASSRDLRLTGLITL